MYYHTCIVLPAVGTMGLWDCGTVGLWDYGTVGLWDCGTVVLWDCGTVVLWDCGTVVRYKKRTIRCKTYNVTLYCVTTPAVS